MVHRYLRRLTDDDWQGATLLGLAAIPVVVALSTADGGHVSIDATPVFLAGVVVGWLYSDHPIGARRAGRWTGLIAAVGIAPVELVHWNGTLPDLSLSYQVGLSVISLVLAAVMALVTVLVAWLGALLGARLSRAVSRVRTDRATGRASR